jgi:hypothetical protein
MPEKKPIVAGREPQTSKASTKSSPMESNWIRPEHSSSPARSVHPIKAGTKHVDSPPLKQNLEYTWYKESKQSLMYQMRGATVI